MNISKRLDRLLGVWYIFLSVSVICSFRAISSIAIGLVILTGVVKNKIDTGLWLNIKVKNLFMAACCLFYVLQVAVLLYTANFNDSAKHLQTQTGIICVPLALCCSNYLNTAARRTLMRFYIWIVAAVLLYCLLVALYKYVVLHMPANVFFYHELVSPFRQHAVQVSLLLFAGLIYLLENARNGSGFGNRIMHFSLVFFFTCCIVLLSSKLVISFSACCLAYYLFLFLKVNLNSRFAIFTSVLAGLAVIVLVLLTQNSVSERFGEILSGNLRLVQQKNFNPAVYFNGLQFRLLQWRFVKEILTEQHAWFTGVSDSAQILLDKKYISTHMYIGSTHSEARGYLGYNTHNQFLQSLLQCGVPGLLVFILICYAMVRLAICKRNRELTIMVIILIAYCFNEAVFETQYGIILFNFFPLFIYYGFEEKLINLSPIDVSG